MKLISWAPISDTMLCQVKMELRLSSGRLSLEEGEIVRVVAGVTTFWVYPEEQETLLHTFNSFEEANKHLVQIVPEKQRGR